MDDEFLAKTEAFIEAWHGIKPPNAPGKQLAKELALTVDAFTAQRGRLRFEDEPSSFEAALLRHREPGA